MTKLKKILIAVVILLVAAGGALYYMMNNESAEVDWNNVTGPSPTLTAPKTHLIPTINIADVIGWEGDTKPTAAAGLVVTSFARDLANPRNILVLPNGDILVAQSGKPEQPDKPNSFRTIAQNILMKFAGSGTKPGNNIILLRDANGDGVAELKTVLIEKLNSPFGMAVIGDQLYVANTDALVRYPYKEGDTKITAPGVKFIDLPGGPINHHWTKNLLASPDGAKLYVSIGSNSNVGEAGIAAEKDRAMIWEVDTKSGDHRVFAYGLRNPTAMAWEPRTGQLFTVVNERDEIGSDLVPDYLTSVQFGGFYGWPWYYWGARPDVRAPEADQDLASYSIPPDYALGPHVAALGLSFADKAKLGGPFTNGAFIGEHGSWNRRPPSGYKVTFVRFENGKPVGKPIDVLTGFLNKDGDAHGRPVGVAVDSKGALLVADDGGNRIWRVAAR